MLRKRSAIIMICLMTLLDLTTAINSRDIIFAEEDDIPK